MSKTWFRSANRHSNSTWPPFDGAPRGSSVPLGMIAMDADDDEDELSLARDMIEVHGANAATVARENARTAALAGQRPQVRHWIRVLEIIQQIQAGKLAVQQ